MDISNGSRISAWYPLDMLYRCPKGVDFSERKISRCRARPNNISFGDLTIWTSPFRNSMS